MPLNYKSFSAWIVIDGKVAEEFNVETTPDVNGTKVTCWIPSEAGKTFEVRFKDSVLHTASEAITSIDGNFCGGRVLQQGRTSQSLKGFSTSSTTIRPFVFSKLELAEEDDDFALATSAANVGEIAVDIRYVKIIKYGSAGTKEAPAEQKFNEKTKKGIDHQTSFGDAVLKKHTSRRIHTKALGKDVVHFRFRYRPLEILRAHGIAPPAPVHSPPAEPQAERKRMKREASPDVPEDVKPRNLGTIVISDDEDEVPVRRKKIKREHIKAEFANAPLLGDFIDLT